MRLRSLPVVALLLLSGAAVHAEDLAAERRQILELGRLTAVPTMQPAEGFAGEAGLRAIFYDALSWKGKPTKGYRRHAWAGPQRNGIYGNSSEPLADQWIYHAVADTVLANSLLRSLPEVDADKVGVMGISWGGVITSTVIGIDERFAFAIPMYGCGELFKAANQYG
jgi:hypothetical protein